MRNPRLRIMAGEEKRREQLAKTVFSLVIYFSIVMKGLENLSQRKFHGELPCEMPTPALKILGAAQGLAYLHHDCVPPIVHRDIKANNILIGPEFEVYIADFGLAKLVDNGDFARSSSTVAGSYGYIAPEYGYMMKITEKSDVYSYGVVVLEVLTGKQPIDPTIPDGIHIVDWVRQKRGGIEVLDPSLGVALLCVNPSPDDRPTMKDVAAMLKEIKQKREECMKVSMVLNGSSECNHQGNSNSPSSMMQNSYPQSNSKSFSASSLLYPSSASNAKPTFK